MDINYFKDTLFDLINESDALEAELADIQSGEQDNALVVTMKDGSRFSIRIEIVG